MEVITTHLNADFDAMASMIGAKKLYPDAVLVFPGSQEQSLREFFINSTFFLFGFKRLKDIDITQIRRLVLVDTRQLSRIGKFEEIVNSPDLEIHIYDHHPNSDDDIHGRFELVKPVGATVTILTQVLRERGIPLTSEEATILSLGLFEDTGSFTFSSTTPEDFEAGAFLRSCGADLNLVADMITRELTSEQIALLNELLHSARTYTIHGVEVCISTVSTDKYVGDFSVLVHKLRDMENLDVIFALARMEDRVYMVARSRIPDVNVGTIAAYFGGGGHPTAASATIRDLTLIEAEDRLFELLQSTIKPTPLARDLMSSPVIHTSSETTIGDAAQTMVRYNINAMPVLENDHIVGIINRQFLEKAVYHKLEHQPINEYMNVDVSSVSPDATLVEIQKQLVEHQQRIIPVVENERLVGVITRRDLLKFLTEDDSNTPKALREDLGAFQWGKRKNVSSVIAEQLPREIIQMLREFGELAERLHYKVYAVGGCVRDLMLRHPQSDIDLVVEGDGIEFARIYAQEHGIRARSHKKFNTSVLIFPDDRRVDVASARLEYYPYPAALPVVEFSSLKMDLYRRDFTINTLSIALNPNEFGQLIDFFGGHRDLKDKVIRVLHSLSFVEDPTRVLRAIRFEQRFGLRIEKQTANLIRNAVRLGLIQKLGGHRLFNEIQHIFMEEDPLPAIRRMAEFGVLSILSPEMRLDKNAETMFIHMRDVISWYRLSFLDEPLNRWWIYLLGLLSGLSMSELKEVFTRLELSEAQQERIIWTFVNGERLLRGFFQLRNLRPSDIYRTLQPFRPEELVFLMARARKEEVLRSISHYFHRYRHVVTELKGRDLMAMGIRQGPIYRVILDDLLNARLNGEVKDRREEVAFVRRRYEEHLNENPAYRCECPAPETPAGE
jgi:tRNA nucleotidyltransferase (CCA-adding enzyme)